MWLSTDHRLTDTNELNTSIGFDWSISLMIDFHGLGISFIRQSLETPAPPTPGMAGNSLSMIWVWKPVKFPDTGAKILSPRPLVLSCT